MYTTHDEFDPTDKNFPTTPQEVTDRHLVGVLGMALYGCAYWCDELRVEDDDAVPDRLTPEQASALRGEPTDTGDTLCFEELPLLGATWVFVPCEPEMPEARLSIPRLRDAVAQIYCREAARGHLGLGDFGPPVLDAQQADAAVQLALFGEILFG
ncbi:hypothetical protein ACFP9V_18465 [Deinococcus radiopugnans]|uniref:Uncharacterized protein n=1 Tax=Deinococcus radiopugnans ATCC 19172 TaxID=585398 RepID=A0A5C4Y924_9DEIO|nr:hypothetical protein [Deinococcus radiopugnans]MBB6017458.1 hypothetical protein [Deinococcus radiopugnans ATCC 19172]TNM71984.1 hypothetical protein FHR04_06375 [Deinococcus radiopugnans ATCC 19172]